MKAGSVQSTKQHSFLLLICCFYVLHVYVDELLTYCRPNHLNLTFTICVSVYIKTYLLSLSAWRPLWTLWTIVSSSTLQTKKGMAAVMPHKDKARRRTTVGKWNRCSHLLALNTRDSRGSLKTHNTAISALKQVNECDFVIYVGMHLTVFPFAPGIPGDPGLPLSPCRWNTRV